MNNDKFIELIDECHSYTKMQHQLSEIIAQGFFQLALSRKSGQIRTDPSNLREDFDAHIRISSEEGEINTKLISEDDKEEFNPILLITAMPNVHLFKAQKSFKLALLKIVECAKYVRSIDILLPKSSS